MSVHADDVMPRRANHRSPMVRRAFLLLAWAFVVCLVIQFFLVGVQLFEAAEPSDLHRDFAYAYGWLAPALVLLAAVAIVPRRVQVLAVLLLVLYAVQTYLPTIAEQAPWLAALHAVNALAVFGVAVGVARGVAWRNPEEDGTPGR
jgi:hypothetical protein